MAGRLTASGDERPSRISAAVRTCALAAGTLASSVLFAGAATAANSPPISKQPPPSAVTRPPTPPTLSPLQATSGAVTVGWTDASVGEVGFVVYRRDASGAWQAVQQIRTRNSASTGDGYSWVDGSTSPSGQCYMVAATNSIGPGNSAEECTVRPDPSRFPQTVPAGAIEWTGLSGTNDGTGKLAYLASTPGVPTNLVYGDERFGVDLQWVGQPADWTIQTQGGPHLMDGQAVALEAAPGKWLAYGHETYGVDLVYSSAPSYEWYVVGGAPGSPLSSNGQFALWDSASGRYLVWESQTFGVDLNWESNGGVGSPGVSQGARVTMTAQPPVGGHVPFSGGLGGNGAIGVVNSVFNLSTSVTLLFPTWGHGASDCGDAADVVALSPQQSLTAGQLQLIWGTSTPTLAQRLPLLACAQTQASSLTVTVLYNVLS